MVRVATTDCYHKKFIKLFKCNNVVRALLWVCLILTCVLACCRCSFSKQKFGGSKAVMK